MEIILLLTQIGFIAISYILHKRMILMERTRVIELNAINNALKTMREIEIQQNKWLGDISEEIIKHKKIMQDDLKTMGLLQ